MTARKDGIYFLYWCGGKKSLKKIIAPNGFWLCEEADYGTQNCHCATKADAMQNVQITTKPAFLQNQCYRAFFLVSSFLKFKLKTCQ
jgi:hypothetical protein